MDYINTTLCKIRTITVFLSLDTNKKQWEEEITQACVFLFHASQQLADSGYSIQSLRIVTNPFGEYMNTSSAQTAKDDLQYLSGLRSTLAQGGIRLRFAIGEALTYHEISLLPELIKEFGDLCNACVNINFDECGILDNELILHSASEVTPRGEGNFNFTVNCNCQPLILYFPASYHKKDFGNRFVIGLETPDLLVHALQKQAQVGHLAETHNSRFKQYFEVMATALQYHVSNIQNFVDEKVLDDYCVFAGFDSSAAPSKSCSSIVEVYELMGVDYFGAAGTVEVSSLLTKVFQSIRDVNLVGFSGLMLAVTEDAGLALGSIQSHFDIRSLLTWYWSRHSSYSGKYIC